ncbi:hypothetical protein C1922_05530 [Stenotrophomonas sp. ZAC14D2_NAIMI4_7]|uniref:hypothetical protein n=1 Tax=Stenotrophomonas sp. ZAC14D2_NAIMI4_7 TaxID=2072405 RepID=UPI000D53F411|nr:hypothetical protein [Stenotrophomonas sp. ZAC14D2_NAIMI4_7]AWH16814.1 hypothetical protein C1922_05530 [Stenotrophomonas sp. ZAC14D2_NAIMI4_7]
MRSIVGGCLALALMGCSRAPADASASAATTAAAADATVATTPAADAPPGALAAQTVDPLFGAVAAGSEAPAHMLNRYILDLLNGNRSGSDAAWAFAPADPRHADDALLRQLPDLHSLRLDSEPPLPRDNERPSRLLEVPVRVRASTGQGTFRFHGWYRVQPRADGQGWQIQSAKLEPTLD